MTCGWSIRRECRSKDIEREEHKGRVGGANGEWEEHRMQREKEERRGEGGGRERENND